MNQKELKMKTINNSKIRLALVLILILSIGTPSEAQQTAQTQEEWIASINTKSNVQLEEFSNDEEEKQFFKDFIIEYNRSWSPGDTDNFDIKVPAIFYNQTDRLFAYDLFPPTDGFQGWEDYSKELTRIVKSSSYFVAVPDVKSFRYARNGDVAWMSATLNASGITLDGIEYSSEARQTVILEKTNNIWLVVHEHISVPYLPSQN